MSANSHWEPIHKRCDPCRFQPQVVVDMDTFSRDSAIVLRRMGMEHVLHELNRTQQQELELNTLMDYNFQLINSSETYQGCVTPTELARLLWKAFQINGYLPLGTLYSPDEEKPFSVDDFKNRVLQVLRDSASQHVLLKLQKKQFMRDAFRTLSPGLIRRFRDKFSLDFELFGYSDSPFEDK